MAFRITQCPGCESTFHVTPQLLDIAQGKVRCGACLTVFSALDHALPDPAPPDDETDSVFISTPPREYFDPSTFLTRADLLDQPGSAAPLDDTALVLPESTLDSGLDSVSEAEAEEQSQHASQDEAQIAAAHDESSSPLPESFSLRANFSFSTRPLTPVTPEPVTLILTPEERLPDAGVALQEPESSASAHQLETQPSEPDSGIDSLTESPDKVVSHSPDDSRADASEEAVAESPADSFLAPPLEAAVEPATEAPADTIEQFEVQTPEQPEESVESQETFQNLGREDVEELRDELIAAAAEADYWDLDSVTEVAGDAPETVTIDLDAAEFQPTPEAPAEPAEELSVEAIRARARETRLADEDALEEIPPEHLAALQQFSTPVEFLSGSHKTLKRQLGWSVVAGLAGLLLIMQYLAHELAVYSQSPRWRPLYLWSCEVLPCDLPVYSNIDAIRSDILTVRSHPELDNALSVNLEFRNTAPFPQRFPILILSFNTATNTIFALREFAPGEYLPESLAEFELMPAQTPVQIDLAIVDPGPDAVNYTLGFRLP